MKFFIIDNGTALLEDIVYRITDEGHDYVVQKYSPFESLNPKDADIIILSGGMQNEVVDDLINGVPWYKHEFDLIRNTDKPIFGICLGLQMINVALGGTLKKLDKQVLSYDKHIELTDLGKRHFGDNQLNSLVHEKHQWVVDSYQGTNLQLLGYSKDGIELLHYPKRRMLGTQFHPEYDVSPDSKQLFWDLISVIHSPVGAHSEV